MKIRIIQHEPWLDGGEYVEWAKRNGHKIMLTKCFDYETIPQQIDADMLLVLGGPQNPVMVSEEYPYYHADQERALIKKYIDSGKIVIGSCLGSQLIGEALGAKYVHSPFAEIGYVKGILTKEGKNDEFLNHFPDELFIGEWHHDMPGLTPDTKILMESEGCPRQIVRFGKYVYGFQAHIEFNHQSIINGINNSDDLQTTNSPYMNTVEELMTFDTSIMNKCLSDFLDRISQDYLQNK